MGQLKEARCKCVGDPPGTRDLTSTEAEGKLRTSKYFLGSSRNYLEGVQYDRAKWRSPLVQEMTECERLR